MKPPYRPEIKMKIGSKEACREAVIKTMERQTTELERSAQIVDQFTSEIEELQEILSKCPPEQESAAPAFSSTPTENPDAQTVIQKGQE